MDQLTSRPRRRTAGLAVVVVVGSLALGACKSDGDPNGNNTNNTDDSGRPAVHVVDPPLGWAR